MTEKKDRNGQFSKGIVARRKFQSSRSRCRYSFHEKYFLLFLQTFEFCKNSFGKHLRSKAFMFQNKVNLIYFFFFFFFTKLQQLEVTFFHRTCERIFVRLCAFNSKANRNDERVTGSLLTTEPATCARELINTSRVIACTFH